MTDRKPPGEGNPFGWEASNSAFDASAARDTSSARGDGRTPQPYPRDVARSSTSDVASERRRGLDPAERRRRATRRRFIVIAAIVAVVLSIGTAALGFLLNPFEPEAAPVQPATPTAGPAAEGFVSAGQLAAGQCYDDYTSAWQDELQLADCTSPHDAELYAVVSAAEFAADDTYPGEAELRAEAMRACQAPSSINVAAADEIDDLRIEATYALTQGEWDAGVRSYWCFASRESGEPMATTLTLT